MSQRVKTGFHRIGMVGVAIGAVCAAYHLYHAAGASFAGQVDSVASHIDTALLLFGLGVTWYVAMWAVGWIISGFVGD